MGKTYTSTIDLRCWKEHTCGCCGAMYAYELVRKISGTGATAAKAEVNARKAVERALERDVDMQPCPTCGLLGPDMVGQERAKKLKVVFWLALIAFAVIVIGRLAYLIQSDVAIWAAVAVCALSAVALWRIDLADPNRDPERNRELAAGRVASGGVMHKPGKVVPGSQEMMRTGRSLVHRLAIVLVGAAVLMAAAPELIRTSRHWPLNHELYPPVVGPGDEARVYMNEKIHSIKSYWRGRPEAVLHDGGRIVPAVATTNQNDWGSTINAKSSEKDGSSTPWVKVTIPDDPTLVGKNVTCDLKLNVTYPAFTGGSNFQTTASKMSRSLSLALAPTPGAGGSYSGWWWEGTVGGMVVMLVCTVVLVKSARRLQRQAKPTRVLTPGAPAAV
jgi:hypothetical protein